jgi:hypothetical protein
VLALITLIDWLRLLTTHTVPLGATATVRGSVPTAISASLLREGRSKALTVFVSGLTTQARCAPPLRGSIAIEAEAVGIAAVSGRWTACRKVCRVSIPRSSTAVTVT